MSRFYIDTQTIPWEQIPWPKVEAVVFRLQTRIYQASRSNDMDKMRALQSRLIQNLHARLLAVRQVTRENQGRKDPDIYKEVVTSGSQKIEMARGLRLDGKATPIRRMRISKPREERPRKLGAGRSRFCCAFSVLRARKRKVNQARFAPGKCKAKKNLYFFFRTKLRAFLFFWPIPVIEDRAKQALAKMALETEWEARFEPNSYGSRPGRSCQDAIRAIFLAIRVKPKYVPNADISECFDRINHEAFLDKPKTLPSLAKQVKAWLKVDLMTELGNNPRYVETRNMGTCGVISPLLANIALHGMETALTEWSVGTYPKEPTPILVRYANDFVVLHQSREVIEQAQTFLREWLKCMGLELHSDKIQMVNTESGFQFIGFSINHIWKWGKVRTLITPSRESRRRFLEDIRRAIQFSKGKAAYQLIITLVPKIVGWGNYFKYSECNNIFRRLDHDIFQKIRAWVYRRHPTWGRDKIKQKYFPEKRSWFFQGRVYQDNWILYDSYTTAFGVRREYYLVKLSRIASHKHIEARQDKSAIKLQAA
uniref:ORF533 n=1 Tax=Tetraphis pellucida TaxID=37420 RepID=A0A060DE68_9BRYO|nr:ORF533 [Tetraphis pellucida]AIB08432.1 ORF533 [Tetraphis pellucida]